MVFTGYYEHSIDDKNRLAIPAKFRSRWNDDRDGTGWVIVPGRPAGTLWLYPERHFERLVGQGDSELIPNADQLGFDQTFFPLAEHVELDKQGRILIPERMLQRSGLEREVIICGVRDHLEVRRRDDFEKTIAESWNHYSELQEKARGAYRDLRRQPGPEKGR
jgi:MraZ protein